MVWTHWILASAVMLALYDIAKKASVRENAVLPTLLVSTVFGCAAVLKHHLVHNEKSLSFRRLMEKKAYYSKGVADYQAKWAGHPALKRQFGFYYCYIGVFVEKGKWRRLLRHPILAAVMYIERIAVGSVYLASRLRRT